MFIEEGKHHLNSEHVREPTNQRDLCKHCHNYWNINTWQLCKTLNYIQWHFLCLIKTLSACLLQSLCRDSTVWLTLGKIVLLFDKRKQNCRWRWRWRWAPISCMKIRRPFSTQTSTSVNCQVANRPKWTKSKMLKCLALLATRVLVLGRQSDFT